MRQGTDNRVCPFLFCPLVSRLFFQRESDMDFEKYKFRLCIKACCLYEQLTGRNFFKLSTIDDGAELLYACLVVNNEDLLMTYDTFKTFASDKKVAKWLMKAYSRILEFNQQLEKASDKEDDKDDEKDAEEITMTDMAAALIVRHGVDAHYVMYEMDLWEMYPYLNAADIQRKADLVTQRFWTYLTLSPNINTKKIKSPEELVPFDWEKGNNKAQKDLEENAAAAFAFLSGNKKEEEKE